MTKQKWFEHMKETENVIPPSQGGSRGDWNYALDKHKSMKCAACADRAKTRRATMNRKVREDVYRSAGLIKVYGAVSGRVYWE